MKEGDIGVWVRSERSVRLIFTENCAAGHAIGKRHWHTPSGKYLIESHPEAHPILAFDPDNKEDVSTLLYVANGVRYDRDDYNNKRAQVRLRADEVLSPKCVSRLTVGLTSYPCETEGRHGDGQHTYNIGLVRA